MGYFYSDDESSHPGILGQKWGVRRYENPDGSLTKAGLKRQKIMNQALSKAKKNLKNMLTMMLKSIRIIRINMEKKCLKIQ